MLEEHLTETGDARMGDNPEIWETILAALRRGVLAFA